MSEDNYDIWNNRRDAMDWVAKMDQAQNTLATQKIQKLLEDQVRLQKEANELEKKKQVQEQEKQRLEREQNKLQPKQPREGDGKQRQLQEQQLQFQKQQWAEQQRGLQEQQWENERQHQEVLARMEQEYREQRFEAIVYETDIERKLNMFRLYEEKYEQWDYDTIIKWKIPLPEEEKEQRRQELERQHQEELERQYQREKSLHQREARQRQEELEKEYREEDEKCKMEEWKRGKEERQRKYEEWERMSPQKQELGLIKWNKRDLWEFIVLVFWIPQEEKQHLLEQLVKICEDIQNMDMNDLFDHDHTIIRDISDIRDRLYSSFSLTLDGFSERIERITPYLDTKDEREYLLRQRSKICELWKSRNNYIYDEDYYDDYIDNNAFYYEENWDGYEGDWDKPDVRALKSIENIFRRLDDEISLYENRQMENSITQ